MIKKLTPFIICTLGSFFYIYDYFLAVSPSIMTDDLSTTFSLNAGELGSWMAIFFLASTFFQIPAGVLLDKFGARKLLSLSVLISGLGALLFGVAQYPWELGVARLLMGIGSPFAFLGALFLASRWFAHRYFALIAGLVQLGAALGSIVGGGPLASLVNALGWRHAMLCIGFFTLVLSILFWLILRDGEDLKNIQDIQDIKQNSHPDLVLNSNPERSLLYVLKHPQVIFIALLGFASWASITGIGSLWGIPYLMAVYHWSNTQVGYLYIIFWLGLGLGSPLIGWLSDYLKSRKIPFYICFLIGLVSALLFIAAPSISKYFMILILFLLGFAASAQSLTFGITKDLVPEKYFVATSGLINLTAVLTGLVLQPLMGYLISLDSLNSLDSHDALSYTISNYQISFIPIPIIFLLGYLITLFFIKETKCLNHKIK